MPQQLHSQNPAEVKRRRPSSGSPQSVGQGKPKIILHLGPHKTATTYFQQVLKHNRKRLAEAGVKYIPLDQLRKTITTTLGRPDPAPIPPGWLNCKTLVLFEENFIGGQKPPVKGELYPQLPQRLEALKKLVRGHELEVHMTLRQPADYLLSRHSEYLRHNNFLSFTDYYADIELSTISWTGVVQQMHAALGQKIIVSTFDNAIKNPIGYLKFLTGTEIDFDLDIDNEKNPGVRRSKISNEVYLILSEVSRVLSGGVAQKVLKALENEELPQNTPFQPLSPQVLEALSSVHRNDVGAISNCTYARLASF